MAKVPDYIFNMCQIARDVFALGGADWHINVKMSDKPGGENSNNGFTDVDVTYKNASIEFFDGLDHSDATLEIVLHEMAHVAHSEIDKAFYIARDSAPESERQGLDDLYRLAVERFCQTISRTLVYNYIHAEDIKEVRNG